jgi:hypothetical protein
MLHRIAARGYRFKGILIDWNSNVQRRNYEVSEAGRGTQSNLPEKNIAESSRSSQAEAPTEKHTYTIPTQPLEHQTGVLIKRITSKGNIS